MSKRFELGKKRAAFIDVRDVTGIRLSRKEMDSFTKLDVAYRTLVAILYNCSFFKTARAVIPGGKYFLRAVCGAFII